MTAHLPPNYQPATDSLGRRLSYDEQGTAWHTDCTCDGTPGAPCPICNPTALDRIAAGVRAAGFPAFVEMNGIGTFIVYAGEVDIDGEGDARYQAIAMHHPGTFFVGPEDEGLDGSVLVDSEVAAIAAILDILYPAGRQS